MHGEKESQISVGQGREFANKLDQLGVKNTLLVYPGLNHGFEGASQEQLSNILNTTFKQIDSLLEIDL